MNGSLRFVKMQTAPGELPNLGLQLVGDGRSEKGEFQYPMVPFKIEKQ